MSVPSSPENVVTVDFRPTRVKARPRRERRAQGRPSPPTRPASSPVDLAEAGAWMERLRPALLRRVWPPMTYMIIPSVLRKADTLLAWLDGYSGPDPDGARRLHAELLALRGDFRREA